MKAQNTTFAALNIGTVVAYSDMANDNMEKVILNTYSDQFGTWVNVLDKETNHIEPMSAKTKVGNRWTIVATA